MRFDFLISHFPTSLVSRDLKTWAVKIADGSLVLAFVELIRSPQPRTGQRYCCKSLVVTSDRSMGEVYGQKRSNAGDVLLSQHKYVNSRDEVPPAPGVMSPASAKAKALSCSQLV